MKVGMITFHFVNNFGGVLQTYALKKYLEKQFSVQAEVINYKNWFIRLTDWVRIFPITRNSTAMVAGLKTFKQRFMRLKCFLRFSESYLNISSKEYHSCKQLKRFVPKCDKFICGSDQIWNPIITGGIDDAYYCGFVRNKENVCAYAPSFGTNDIPEFFAKKMARNISSLNYISIREKNSVEKIEQWTGKKVSCLIDPTFLLSREQWKEIAEYRDELPKRYILVYIMQSNYDVYECVRKVKEQYNLPVIDISRYGYNPGFVDKTVIGVGPSEFIALFERAEVVCTNSYHGLVFSLIFGKRLYLIRSKSFALRMINLLEVLNIQNNITETATDISEVEYDIDSVKEIVEKEREKAFLYLNEFLGREHDEGINC